MGLRINTGKTKRMTIGKHHEDIQIKLGGEILEQVTKFVPWRSTNRGWKMHGGYKKKNWISMCSFRET